MPTILLGEARFESAGTGATVEIVRFIELSSTVGEANAEGFAGRQSNNPLTGLANAEGFAPGVAFDASVTGAFGSLHAEGFAATLSISQVTFSAQLGQMRAEGFAPTVNPDFRTIFPQLGEAQARTADGASLEIFNFIAPPDPWYGEVNFVGSVATIGEAAAGVGIIRAEGFAPNIVDITIIFPAVGEMQTDFAGTTAQIERIRVLDGPTTGEKNYVGFQPSADIFREGGIWFAQQATGQINAQGFAPTLAIERTILIPKRENFERNFLEGFAPTVSRPNLITFDPQVGVVNAEGISATITTGRWTPVGSGSQIWSNTSASSGTWTPVDEESTTWTPVDEAV